MKAPPAIAGAAAVDLPGREAELAAIDRLLTGAAPARIALVHGPSGIGKSTLLRAVARRGTRAGWTPCTIDGRELAPLAGELERALRPAAGLPRPLVLFDDADRIGPLGPRLCEGLLPPDAVAVIATRRPPDAGCPDGSVTKIELQPLSDHAAHELLRRRGLVAAEPAVFQRAIDWAQGVPLALALAADAARAHPDWEPAGDLTDAARVLAQAALRSPHRAALAVAALARVATPPLLRDALAGGDPLAAHDWLAALSFVERLADGLGVHELARAAVRSELRALAPAEERAVRRRIADHLYTRAIASEPRLTLDLAELAESPAIRAGYSWDGRARHWIDRLRDGDAELIAGSLEPAWAEPTRTLLQEAPDCARVARDAGGAVCGFFIATTPASAPTVAAADLLLGPWLEHAHANGGGGEETIVWRDSVDLRRRGDRHSLQPLLNVAAVLHSGAANPRYAYLAVDPDRRGFATALAQRPIGDLRIERLPELDVVAGPTRIECHRLDYGRGGLLHAQRALVHIETGAPAPAPDDDQDQLARDVRDALRDFDRPDRLAASPLARGATPEGRAESVRELLRSAIAAAFPDGDDHRRRAIELGYLTPGAGHDAAAARLALNRAGYFRELRDATRTVADRAAQLVSR